MKLILPEEILIYIFSYWNICLFKNKEMLKIYQLSKFWNKYYNKCIITNCINTYCKTHYKEIYIESKYDLWTIFIEHEYINFF
jgi:hypothetical protein